MLMDILPRKRAFAFLKISTTRRYFLLAALQIAVLLAFFPVHMLLWKGAPLWRHSRPSRYSSLEALCHIKPDVSPSRPFDAITELPWLHLNVSLPQNDLSEFLRRRNRLPPRNLDRFPNLAPDHLIFVLYVHKRPQYLRLVVDALSKVEGIGEALLIVSHDGFFEEMNAVVESIRFCQVKQIFAPYSPHGFSDSFPGVSPGDCHDKDDPVLNKCVGNADQYGNHRAPHIVSLKHHWWWMMNTVWDGLPETRQYDDHIIFIEEDHYLFPNAYRNIQILSALKACKCPECYAVNLAPADVAFKGEMTQYLIAEKIGNVGYSFNRTVWRKIHVYAEDFCNFDDYNWDITMWVAVYPKWGDLIYTLRGPRPSARHFGKCGLHQGKKMGQPPCFDQGAELPVVEAEDRIPNIKSDWEVKRTPIKGYSRGFKGWGGWSDTRDRNLCLDFASMYHAGDTL